MYNIAISQATSQPSFGNVRLGKGGAESLAKNLFMKNAKEFITSQASNDSVLLVSGSSVEVMPPRMDAIFDISGRYKRDAKKHFVDVVISDHGHHGTFRIPRNVRNTELYQYGKENARFSLAKIVANEIQNNAKWESLLTFHTKHHAPEVQKVGQELEKERVLRKNAEEIKRLCAMM